MTKKSKGHLEIHNVTPERLGDLEELFETNGSTRGCWCMWFIVSAKERHSGWGAENKQRFQNFVKTSALPIGLIAYRDGIPVGWCATGPRSRYPTAFGPRTKILAGSREPEEDDSVWLVPCFFVRVGYRRGGITSALLNAAADEAKANSAHAIEGFPVVEGTSADAFLGSEKLFESCGFSCIDRPTPRRAVMRRELR